MLMRVGTNSLGFEIDIGVRFLGLGAVVGVQKYFF